MRHRGEGPDDVGSLWAALGTLAEEDLEGPGSVARARRHADALGRIAVRAREIDAMAVVRKALWRQWQTLDSIRDVLPRASEQLRGIAAAILAADPTWAVSALDARDWLDRDHSVVAALEAVRRLQVVIDAAPDVDVVETIANRQACLLRWAIHDVDEAHSDVVNRLIDGELMALGILLARHDDECLRDRQAELMFLREVRGTILRLRVARALASAFDLARDGGWSEHGQAHHIIEALHLVGWGGVALAVSLRQRLRALLDPSAARSADALTAPAVG